MRLNRLRFQTASRRAMRVKYIRTYLTRRWYPERFRTENQKKFLIFATKKCASLARAFKLVSYWVKYIKIFMGEIRLRRIAMER